MVDLVDSAVANMAMGPGSVEAFVGHVDNEQVRTAKADRTRSVDGPGIE